MIYAKTRLKKIPKGCKTCPFYRTESPWGIGISNKNNGMCIALGNFSTEKIIVSRQRLPQCPLVEVDP